MAVWPVQSLLFIIPAFPEMEQSTVPGSRFAAAPPALVHPSGPASFELASWDWIAAEKQNAVPLTTVVSSSHWWAVSNNFQRFGPKLSDKTGVECETCQLHHRVLPLVFSCFWNWLRIGLGQIVEVEEGGNSSVVFLVVETHHRPLSNRYLTVS